MVHNRIFKLNICKLYLKLMTMAMVLAGLFPPQDTAMQCNRGLNWQPFPKFSEPLEEDTLLLVRTPCPRYYEDLEEAFETPELQRIQRDNEDLYRKLTYFTGMDIKTPEDVHSLCSTLRAEIEFGLELPERTRDYHPDKLLNLTKLSFMHNVHTDEMKTFKAGSFLIKMIKEWEDKRELYLKREDRKIYLYTGHDSTIVNVLHELGVWKPQLPLYAIMAIFEQLEDTTTGKFDISVPFPLLQSPAHAEPVIGHILVKFSMS